MDSSSLCQDCIRLGARLTTYINDFQADFVDRTKRKKEWELTKKGIPPAPPPQWPKFQCDGPPLKAQINGCPLCCLFAATFPEEVHKDLAIFPFHESWAIKDKIVGMDDYDDFCLGFRSTDSSLRSRPTIVLSNTRSAARFLRPQEIPELIDWPKIRTWLSICASRDGLLCSRKAAVPGLKLIDCERLTIVRADSSMPWVALSYVWSLAKPRSTPQIIRPPGIELQPDEFHLPGELPGTIEDAIEAAKALGYRYLWADQFCINQQDPKEVADQVGKMDIIYQGAELTLFSTSETNGLLGVGIPRQVGESCKLGNYKVFAAGMDPVSSITRSTWATRGWCFQEDILSRRQLHFTEHGVLFQCYGMSCYEGLGGPELATSEKGISDWIHSIPKYGPSVKDTRRELYRRHTTGYRSLDQLSADQAEAQRKNVRPSRHPQIFDRVPSLEAAKSLISKYTGSNLSYDSDSLNGILGVLKTFKGFQTPLSFCQGLPVYQDDSSRTPFCEDSLLHSLCWFHREAPSARRRDQFPSWSWAGWSGAAAWFPFYNDGPLPKEAFPCLAKCERDSMLKFDAKLLAMQGSCLEPASLGQTNMEVHDCRHSTSCSPLSSKYLLVEAREIPRSLFITKKTSTGAHPLAWTDVFLSQHQDTEYECYTIRQPTVWVSDADRYLSAFLPRLDAPSFMGRLETGDLKCFLVGEEFTSHNTLCVYILVVEWNELGQAAIERFDLLKFFSTWGANSRDTNGRQISDMLLIPDELPKRRFWLR